MNIENKKQLATLLLAAGLGLLTAFLLSQYVQNNIKAKTEELSQKHERQVEKQRQEMAQAIKYMQQDFNTKLTQLAKQQEAQKQELLEAQEHTLKMAQDAQRKARQERTKPKPPAEQVFSVITPPGKRAVTIRMDTLNAVGGLIKSGDRVDVIAKLKIPNQGDDPTVQPKDVTTVLFQDVQVLAVNTKFLTPVTSLIYENQQRARTLNVTLALDPQEAPLLSFAQENGEIKLSLRAPSETGTKIIDVASWDSLSDYLLEEQGTNLIVPVANVEEEVEEVEEEVLEPVRKIQIFKSGFETSL